MSRARETTGGPPRTGRPGAVPPDATGAGPASAPRTAGVEELAVHLTALSDAELASLLAARPDLISPPSPSLTSLAARAGARPSVERALADLDAPALDAARAVLATGSQDPAALAAALGGDEGGVDEEAVAACLEQLTRLCLLTAAGPVTGLVEALRPAPAAASATGAAGAALPAPSRAPDPAELDVQDAAAVADQCARAAEELVRLTSALLAEWGRESAPILRSGGVGARALARTAQALDLGPAPPPIGRGRSCPSAGPGWPPRGRAAPARPGWSAPAPTTAPCARCSATTSRRRGRAGCAVGS